MRDALLQGHDHERVGVVATVAEGCAALALSRGGAAKLYAHRDPNEDAALFALGGAGVLVAVADGHSGHEASVAALQHLRSRWAEGWVDGPPRASNSWETELLEALAGANRAILQLPCRSEPRIPRTTLTLALLRLAERRIVAASIGDSHLFRLGTDTAADLACPPEGAFYLGDVPESPASLARKSWVTTLPLDGVRAVVLATDGLSEVGVGVPDPEAAVLDAVTRVEGSASELRPREAARAVAETALEAQERHGSGDNVAVALAWPDA